MNYTKNQLDVMPDLPTSTENAKLKVVTDTTKVFLCKTEGHANRFEVIVMTKQGDSWLVTQRYPV